MASDVAPAFEPPFRPGETLPAGGAATQRASWRSRAILSSGLDPLVRRIEGFLGGHIDDGAPWLAVAFGCGIAAWFVLPLAAHWTILLAGLLLLAVVALARLDHNSAAPFCRAAVGALALTLAAGTAHVWVKSALLGTPGLSRPFVGSLSGTVVSSQERPADEEWRLLVAVRDPAELRRSVRIRLRVPRALAPAGLAEGAVVRVKVRLMPPAPPMLPGGHDFARTAWFEGIGATGTVLGPVEVLAPGRGDDGLAQIRAALSQQIASRLAGSSGGIAAALASGDRGGISQSDEDALRDAGLSHLLSVSGLHVSAVVAATYLLVVRLLALWSWLALRVRIPLCAAAGAALAGVLYTLLTGAEVPTVRSVVGALLVLAAVALGREPLSLRLLAIAAFVVMLLWPEAIMGPSFQLSFAAVLAIVALHGAQWMRDLVAAREEPWWAAGLRKLGGLLLTGLVIEVALLPIGLYHFHRAGLLGALANVAAIPLTTFVIMPAVALGLLLDLVGAGAPAWWCAGQALSLLLALAHAVAGIPGAVALSPAYGAWCYALLLAGGLWLALWQGRVRTWALVPLTVGGLSVLTVRTPDLFISSDGRHVAMAGLVPGRLALLREPRPGFAQDTLNEMAGLDGVPVALDQWSGTRCNPDFCTVALDRGGRTWHVLVSRGRDPVPVRDMVAACERSDLVVSDRWLPLACRPRWQKLDRRYLEHSGGLSVDLGSGVIETVRQHADDHGWRVTARQANDKGPA